MGALVVRAPGTLHWPAAWMFLGTIAFLGVACDCGWPGPIRRCSRADASMMQHDQPAATRNSCWCSLYRAGLVSRDRARRARYHVSDVPVPLRALGWADADTLLRFIMW